MKPAEPPELMPDPDKKLPPPNPAGDPVPVEPPTQAARPEGPGPVVKPSKKP